VARLSAKAARLLLCRNSIGLASARHNFLCAFHGVVADLLGRADDRIGTLDQIGHARRLALHAAIVVQEDAVVRLHQRPEMSASS